MNLHRRKLKRPVAWSRSRRGIALIMVLLVIMALLVLAGGFAANMRVEQVLARNMANDVRLEWICRSGVELGRYLLGQQLKVPNESSVTSLNQRWAGGDGGVETSLEYININETGLGDGSLLNLLQSDDDDWQEYIEGCKVEVKIVDLEQKVNINWAIMPSSGSTYPYGVSGWGTTDPLTRAMQEDMLNVPNTERDIILTSLQDWVDSDNDRVVNGFDGEDYMRQYGYMPKNDNIADISELGMIHGIRDKLEWLVTGDFPEDPDDPQYIEEEERPQFLFPDLFTAISLGKVNINTAPREVLILTDPNMEQFVVDNLINERQGEVSDDSGADPAIRQVSELLSLGYPTVNMQQDSARLNQIFGVTSAYFEINVKATTVEGQAKELVAIVFREDDRNLRVLQSYWKTTR